MVFGNSYEQALGNGVTLTCHRQKPQAEPDNLVNSQLPQLDGLRKLDRGRCKMERWVDSVKKGIPGHHSVLGGIPKTGGNILLLEVTSRNEF